MSRLPILSSVYMRYNAMKTLVPSRMGTLVLESVETHERARKFSILEGIAKLCDALTKVKRRKSFTSTISVVQKVV